ncbi:translation initiation factor eIF-2B subunit alpha [Elasticomyces elasticus]|nr:translation initiation factor eIF-2B subunit alpha [Elasticomyces elasticus]KAK4980149.1 translation initiation factor eIF-2B subunit alpha [Elasticomyces elasticus]
MTTRRPSISLSFNVVATYHKLLLQDRDLTMPIAAIESLILGLAQNSSTTVSETLDLVSKLTSELKNGVANPISLSAGTDLFQQYLLSNLQRARGDFETAREHLVQNSRLFVERAKAARETIAGVGRPFIRDGHTILTNGGSRVVGTLLKRAAESNDGRGSVRFRVIYVVSESGSSEENETIKSLRGGGIEVAEIPPTAIAYCMDMVTSCFVGAEGVVENGGVVNRLGTYQMATLAKAAGKPFYVVSESHKFVRLYPLGQYDLGIEQKIVDFRTAKGSEAEGTKDEGVADLESEKVGKGCLPGDQVDYTPPRLISGIITEGGVLLPSAPENDRNMRCDEGRWLSQRSSDTSTRRRGQHRTWPKGVLAGARSKQFHSQHTLIRDAVIDPLPAHPVVRATLETVAYDLQQEAMPVEFVENFWFEVAVLNLPSCLYSH